MKLGGNECQCPTCGLVFTGDHWFQKHRAGPVDARRCLTGAELTALGLAPNEKGRWRKAASPAEIARLRGLDAAQVA